MRLRWRHGGRALSVNVCLSAKVAIVWAFARLATCVAHNFVAMLSSCDVPVHLADTAGSRLALMEGLLFKLSLEEE